MNDSTAKQIDLESLIHEVSRDDLPSILKNYFDSESVIVSGAPVVDEINAAHNDDRTLGIFRVSGSAVDQGQARDWSIVVKIVAHVDGVNRAAAWVDPKIEELVYSHGLFADESHSFRAVKWYGVSSLDADNRILWLEDMSGASKAPFTFEELFQSCRNVGEFNGLQAVNPDDIPFEIPSNSFRDRWDSIGFAERSGELVRMADDPVTRRVFGSTALECVFDLHSVSTRLMDQLKNEPSSLAFGDCQPGNLFFDGGKTVAIDWASLTRDPIGVDAGILIGASTTWGSEGESVLRREKDLFEAYLEGLTAVGVKVDKRAVRKGFFGQFCVYLMLSALSPGFISGNTAIASAHFLETRFGVPLDEIPDLLAPIVASIPSYIDEIEGLI